MITFIQIAVAAGVLAFFIVPRWRRYKATRRMMKASSLAKAVPRFVDNGKGPSTLAESPTKKYKLSP